MFLFMHSLKTMFLISFQRTYKQVGWLLLISTEWVTTSFVEVSVIDIMISPFW